MHGVASRARGDVLNDPPLHCLYTVFCAWSRRASDAFQLRKAPKNPPRVVQERVDRPFFSMETTRDPLFTPKNPVQSNQQPSKSGVNPVCGTARRAAPVRRNDSAGRSVASGARPPLFGDGGNAARDQGGGSLCRLGGGSSERPSIVDGTDKRARYMAALLANGPHRRRRPWMDCEDPRDARAQEGGRPWTRTVLALR